MATLPTTRRGRFLFRKKRYTTRRQKQASIWNVFNFVGGEWVWVGRYKRPNVGPLQQKSGLVHDPHGPHPGPLESPYPRWISGGGYADPPHSKSATFPFHPPLSAVLPYGWRKPLNGYHVRQVKTCRPHARQMNAIQRRVWGANCYYHRNGLFPDADPLGRTPNDSNPPATEAGYFPEGDWPSVSPRDV
jgi:hypothetical protein